VITTGIAAHSLRGELRASPGRRSGRPRGTTSSPPMTSCTRGAGEVPDEAPARAVRRREGVAGRCEHRPCARAGAPVQAARSDGLRDDVDLLMVRVETFATELTPQGRCSTTSRSGSRARRERSRPLRQPLHALPLSIPFRPAQRAHGRGFMASRTALVTAEEFSKADRTREFNANASRAGPCVSPGSAPGRRPEAVFLLDPVSAGTGQDRASRALYTPRVGHEVLVRICKGIRSGP